MSSDDKLTKRPRRLTLSITLASALILAALIFVMRPRRVEIDEYNGVKLGMSMTELKYVLGTPTTLYSSEGDNLLVPTNFSDIPKYKHLSDYVMWGWTLPTGANFEITFDQHNLVGFITCIDSSTSGTRSCPPLNGVIDGDSEKKIVDAFGKPDKRRLFDSGDRSPVTLSLEFDSAHVGFSLSRDSVDQLYVTNNFPK